MNIVELEPAEYDRVEEALKDVIDPEIGVNIVDLGLIYGLQKSGDDGSLLINMTLTSAGCPLTDVLDAIEHHGWHWAFYSCREDTRDAMDYELGTAPLPPGYWSAVEAGHPPTLVHTDTLLWRTLARRFANRRD